MYFIQSTRKNGKPFNVKVFQNPAEFLRDLLDRKKIYPPHSYQYQYGKTIEPQTV